MIILPTLEEINDMHERAIRETGGSFGIRDQGALESAVAQPSMAYGGQELYPTLVEKAAAIAFSLVKNHAYIDGNKRIGYAAMLFVLLKNGYDLTTSDIDQEAMFWALAGGRTSRDELVLWIKENAKPTDLDKSDF